MTQWWIGLPPAQATVDCAGQTHRLRWRSGELRALDHEDADAERTLAALGGQSCPCVDVLDGWHKHAADLAVLVLASRGPADPLADLRPSANPAGPAPYPRARPRPVASTGSTLTARSVTSVTMMHAGRGPAPAVPSPDPDDEQLVTLLGLGGGLPDRLVATVVAHWAQRLGLPDEATRRALPRLHAALYGRALATLRTWLGDPGLDVQLTMLDEAAEPYLNAAEGEQSGIVRAGLPFGWLASVWAKGLAVTAGRFCLAAAQSGDHWTLSTIGPDLATLRPVRIELAADDEA